MAQCWIMSLGKLKTICKQGQRIAVTIGAQVVYGGTGLDPRDRTPEATLAVADRLAPGFAEAMRSARIVAVEPKGAAVVDPFAPRGPADPSAWFGAPDRIRLSYALELPKIQEGLARIGEYIQDKKDWLL